MITETNKKSWFRKHWIISLFLILGIFGMIGDLFDSGDTSNITGNVVNEQFSRAQESFIEEIKICSPDWICSSWVTCDSSETQTRTCTDSNDCNTPDKPVESTPCEYEIPQKIKQEIETSLNDEDYSWGDWWSNLEKMMEDLDESLGDIKEEQSVYKKIDECTNLCAGEDISIPYVKSICYSDCSQIYHYGGEESLDRYIEELK